jgi:tetratricopeptide (TPR) repeat protein
VLRREAALEEGVERAALLREAARVAEARGEDDGVAMDAWRDVLEADEHDLEALTQMLALAERGGEVATYLEIGRVLVTVVDGSERGSLLTALGHRSLEGREMDSAVRFFEQAMANSPPDPSAALQLEQIYTSKADWNGVVRALGVQADASADAETKVAALVRAARVESETRHDREMAAVYYQKALEVQPNHDSALRFMARHLYDAGQTEQAMEVSARLSPMIAEGQDLDDFDVRMELCDFHFSYGELLRSAQQGSEAMDQYAAALKYNPTHLPSLEAVGPLFIARAQWKQAEQTYRQLLQLTGGHGDKEKMATTYTQLGLVEHQLGNESKAYKRFNKALELHPNHVGALKGMALTLESRKDWSNLLNIFNNIIYHATRPQDVIDAYMTKGRILDDYMDRPDKAAQHYQRSLDFDANQPSAYLRLAELAMRRDDYAGAARLAENGLRLEEDKVALVRGLLLASVASGRRASGSDEDAAGLIEQACGHDSRLTEQLSPNASSGDIAQVVRAALPR